MRDNYLSFLVFGKVTLSRNSMLGPKIRHWLLKPVVCGARTQPRLWAGGQGASGLPWGTDKGLECALRARLSRNFSFRAGSLWDLGDAFERCSPMELSVSKQCVLQTSLWSQDHTAQTSGQSGDSKLVCILISWDKEVKPRQVLTEHLLGTSCYCNHSSMSTKWSCHGGGIFVALGLPS